MNENLIHEYYLKAVEYYASDTLFDSLSTTYQEMIRCKMVEYILEDCVKQVSLSIPDTMCASSGAYKTARIAAISGIKNRFRME